ncbi:hypothetical protein XENTR_v10011983 [Xenopus tropicalis]|nr:hypothetical protein XENTR_v10011983 [Xenopus tropicalis]
MSQYFQEHDTFCLWEMYRCNSCATQSNSTLKSSPMFTRSHNATVLLDKYTHPTYKHLPASPPDFPVTYRLR